MLENTPRSTPLIDLKCSCCGGNTIGRQWHNRDKGWGLCSGCVGRCLKGCGNDNDEFEQLYGTRGVYCDIRYPKVDSDSAFKYSTVSKLENHERKWEVFFNGLSIGYSDAENEEAARHEVFENEVQRAIYGNIDDFPNPPYYKFPRILDDNEYPF